MRIIAFAGLAFIAIAVLFYGVAAFIAWQANPGDWSDYGRFAYAIFTVTFGGIVASAIAGLS